MTDGRSVIAVPQLTAADGGGAPGLAEGVAELDGLRGVAGTEESEDVAEEEVVVGAVGGVEEVGGAGEVGVEAEGGVVAAALGGGGGSA